ncbi:guanylate-binding protein 2-like isoform X2 [Mercenaria mercenaria]|uniref:guanylate-binding protein 2-like isoform X2 n=1 Tax=Mercenaria mercenaria TaxID=6596 RepID=UPI00234F82C3|nr:guanylate-binding protein 2-like isoform X2 [Mercenaria mercenaria]
MTEPAGPRKLTDSRYSVFNKPAQTSTKQPVSPIFETPMRLVVNTDGKTTLNHETLAELSKIEKTLNVVSVVGSLRTGKSFLLNKLANTEAVVVKNGFETGHTTKAVTKGIWVMCRPHPTQEEQVLVLLDTEGIDDPDKVEITDDQWLFILSTLLSSTMVYNTRGHFDRPAIDKFRFLREIKTSISVTGATTDDSILDFFFPNFVLALRDFNLTIEEKTADVFLEGKLVLQRGLTDSIRKFNEPRQLIRRYFKKRRCFIFIKPAKQKLISQLMKVPETDLKPEFLQTLNSFRDYIFSCAPKTLKSGRGINGRMLATLLTNYVNSIQDGKPPCLSEAMATMADIENACAVEKATEVYNTEMKKRIVAHNTPTDTGLVTFHRDSMKAAIEVLKTGLVFDDEQVYEEQAVVKFKELLRKFKSAADKNSRAICLNRLEILNLKVVKKMNNRVYCHPAGYDEYMKDIDWLIKQYNKDAPYLGTKARASLQEFLDGKESEEEKVYQMVLQAQGTQEKSRPRIQRLRSLTEEDPQTLAENEKKKATEEEKIEKEIKRDITVLQINGMKSIGSQYFEMLEMKIKELERVKNELSSDDPYYESLLLETEHWKKLLEKATWNMPQYKNKLQPITESSSEVKDLTTSQVSKSSEKVDDKQDNEVSKQKERAPGDGGDARPKYDENYFRVKPNPAPIDPESIDSKFIIDLERRGKKKDKTECPIL